MKGVQHFSITSENETRALNSPFFAWHSPLLQSANKHITQSINCLSCTSHVPSKPALRTVSLLPSHPSGEDLSSPRDLSVATQLDHISLNWSFADVALRDFFLLYLNMKCIRYWCGLNTFENIFFYEDMEKQKWEGETEKDLGKKRVCYDQRDEENGGEDQCKDRNG